MKNYRIADTKEKEVFHSMPTVENVNYEMADYLSRIRKYVSDYTRLPEEEAKKRAQENLMNSGIVDAYGKLTGFYKK